jgi:hypothetical protein
LRLFNNNKFSDTINSHKSGHHLIFLQNSYLREKMKKFILICLLTGLTPANAATINDFKSIYDNSLIQSIEKNGLVETLSNSTNMTLANSKRIDTSDEDAKSNAGHSEESRTTTNNNLSDPVPTATIPALLWLLASGFFGLLGMRAMRGIKTNLKII